MLVPCQIEGLNSLCGVFNWRQEGGLKKRAGLAHKKTIDGSTHMIHEHLFALPHEHASQLYSFSTTP